MKKNNKGFSLVELIIVIAIMAVLIGLLAPQYLKFVQKSKISADCSNAQALATAINVGFADGKITKSDSFSGNGKGTITATDKMNKDCGVTAWPESKSTGDGTATWSVSIGSNGVSGITLGGKKIWPVPESPFTQD